VTTDDTVNPRRRGLWSDDSEPASSKRRRARGPARGGGVVEVLFVCTANRIRSPFAAAVASRIVEERGLPVTVRSAGFISSGEQVVERMELTAKRYDLDLSEHLSTTVDAPLLERADLVVTMTGRHAVELMDLDPSVQRRVLTLREWATLSSAGNPVPDWTVDAVEAWAAEATDRPISSLMSRSVDISDPAGRSRRRFRRIAALIDESVRACFGDSSAAVGDERPAVGDEPD